MNKRVVPAYPGVILINLELMKYLILKNNREVQAYPELMFKTNGNCLGGKKNDHYHINLNIPIMPEVGYYFLVDSLLAESS